MSDDHLAVVARRDRDADVMVDRHREDGTAVLLEVMREVRSAAHEADAQGRDDVDGGEIR